MVLIADDREALRHFHRRVQSISDTNWREFGLSTLRRYAVPFIAAYILTVIVYSYLFTTIIFTNHTIPNAWVYSYPSFKTKQEGRWFADIIILLTGGSGVQAFQMAFGSAIQIINGFLFASLLRVKKIFYIFLMAVFLALHPAFLDYYSFTVDHISFALGDTLGLLGVVVLARTPDQRVGIVLAIVCFVLMLATYQPKIGLMAVLLLIWCLDGVADIGMKQARHFRPW